ncbi:MAG: DUF6390 family protein [Acidimicrobiia bacterium]|jgi:hypothetical protein
MISGPELFFRYARPPNELGYCGPGETGQVAALAGGVVTPRAELTRIAAAFHGAWPYLELISQRAGLSPLSAAVVEAYWMGNDLLGQVDLHDWGNSVDERFRAQSGRRWPAVVEALNHGGSPNHAFHVFCVYPWVGLLREGFVEPAVEVLDRCRISRGRVVRGTDDGQVVVSSRRLEWVDHRLVEAEPTRDLFKTSFEGLEAGDIVSLHWDYVCQRLDRHRARALRLSHDRHLQIANEELRRARLEPAH